MPKLASAIRELGVPTSLIFDIDVLADKDLLEKAIVSLGGVWEDYKKDWKVVDSDVRKGVKPLSKNDIKKAITSKLNEAGEDELPKSDVEALLKRTSPWQMIKDAGANGIPKGNATRSFRSLLDRLAKIGLHIVPVGEIENFARHIGKHGSAFVSEALNTIDLDDELLAEAREFVRRVCGQP